MNKKVIVIGAGGHGRVIADIIEKSNDEVIGFLDDNVDEGTKILNHSVIGKVSDIDKFIEEDNFFIVGIGNNSIRKKIAEQYKVKYYTAIHPTTVISNSIIIGEGTVVMAHATINNSAKVGKQCIINTGSIVEHDNILEDYVHISPRAVLGGTVKIGESTHIGIGAVVRNNITIGKDNLIGAGAVVVKDIDTEGNVYVGVPAKILIKK